MKQYKWIMLALLSCAFFFHQADRVLFGLLTMIAFFIGSLSPLMIGALSDKCGMRGFELGFAILGVAYVAGAVAVFASFLWTFKRNRVSE